jgi:hypothetical protein
MDMNDVECRARSGCVRENFLKAAKGSIWVLAGSANMHVHGSTMPRSNLECLENF